MRITRPVVELSVALNLAGKFRAKSRPQQRSGTATEKTHLAKCSANPNLLSACIEIQFPFLSNLLIRIAGRYDFHTDLGRADEAFAISQFTQAFGGSPRHIRRPDAVSG